MKPGEAQALLNRIAIFRHACDLDLLLFFVSHPWTLLTSESLAAYLGYELKQIAESLETLIAAGLLKRTQTPAHAARLYMFDSNPASDERLRSLLEIASTRQGRAALRKVLATRSNPKTDTSPSVEHDSGIKTDRSRPFMVLNNQRSRARGGL